MKIQKTTIHNFRSIIHQVIDCKDFTSGIATCAGFKTDLVVLDKLKEDKTIEIVDKAGNKITAKIKVNKKGSEYEAILLK